MTFIFRVPHTCMRGTWIRSGYIHYFQSTPGQSEEGLVHLIEGTTQ